MVITSTYVEVDVDLSEFDDDEIIEYLEGCGYTVIDKSSDDSTYVQVDKLYRNWLTLSPEQFEKELKKFFGDVLDINVL